MNLASQYIILTPGFHAKRGSNFTALAISNDTQNALDHYYQYVYDHRNRLVEKKIPGKGWEYIVYDKQNRPTLTQDANLKGKNQWFFTKYDKFGRVAYTGIYSRNAARVTLQNEINNHGSNNETRTSQGANIEGVAFDYTNSAFPSSNLSLLSVHYYDNYGFTGNHHNSPTSIEGQAVKSNVQGMTIAIWKRALGTSQWSKTNTYYDIRGRVIRVHTRNHLGGYTQLDSQVDFRGKALHTTVKHKRLATDRELVVVDRFEYDDAERPTKQWQKINSGTEQLIAENGYDELGRLSQKPISGGLQTIDYAYNIRGWLKSINNGTTASGDLFGFRMNYNDPQKGATPLFNGNISETIWKTNNIDPNEKYYKYGYDALNRITQADFNVNAYDLTRVAYDKNGNIVTLNRNKHSSAGGNDQFAYGYDGNQLVSLSGSQSGSFTYDANGQ